MRQVMAFLLAGAVFVAGVTMMLWQLYMAPAATFVLVAMGLVLAVAGAGWIIADFMQDR
jgi:hypothetical protein